MRILVFIVFIFLSTALAAQKFYNVGVEEGLSSHQAYGIVQDKNGFIWVSTKAGIDRFDGENIVNYGYPGYTNMDSYSLIKLRTDPEKNIWAFTEEGQLFSFAEGRNQFEHLFSLRDSTDSNASMLNLYIDKYAWLCTDLGLWIFDPDNRKIEETPYLKDERVKLVYPYSEDKYLIALTNKLVEFNRRENKVDTLFSLKAYDLNTSILSVYWDRSTNEIWVGTQTGDVFIYSVAFGTIINLKDLIPELPGVPVFKIVASTQNEIYLGSDGGGVFKIDSWNKKLLDNYREDVDDANSMVGGGVRDLYMSDAGNLFISSFTGGLNILSNSVSGFEIIRHQINNPNSLKNNVVNNVLEDIDGDVWFATNNGVSCWLKRKNKWVHFLDDSNSVGNVFLSLLQHNRNTIIAGSYGNGIYYISKKDGVIDHVYPGKKNPQQQANADYIVDIFKDTKNKIWTGDTFKELAIYDPNKNSYNYIPLIGVKSIQAKDDENIFVGAQNGIYTVNIHTLEYQKIQLPNDLPTSFFVNSLNFDSKKQILWIATSGLGLLKWNVISNKIEQLNKEHGLPSNHIYAVLTHEENIIWASSEKGLSRYNILDGNIENFSIKDGLSDDAFYKNSKCKTNSGDFYFGSYQGATYFNPEDIKVAEENALVYLEELLISNKTIYSNDNKSPLKKSLNQTKDLVLKYNESSFSIGFTSITPVNSGKIKYSWKLEGQDENWTIPSYYKRANYTNVSKGNFQFRLKALSDRTEEVLDERVINIVVKSAPWNTLWARIVYTLFLIIIVGLVYRYLRISDMKKLSDAKIQFFTNTAHDIKTPLTLASAPLGDLQKSKNLDKRDKYLLNLSVSNLSNLSSSVNHLLDFQKSDMGKSQLILAEENLVHIIKDRFAFFSQAAETNNIKFECIIEPKVLFEWIDTAKIEKVIDNLLSNAIKYTDENGLITMHLKATETIIQIIIKDTGIGIPHEDQKSLFKRYFRGQNAINSKISGTGIGLLLSRNYIFLHKGSVDFNSKEGVGTEFIVSLKRGKTHYGKDAIFVDGSLELRTSVQIQAPVLNKNFVLQNEKKKIKLLLAEDNDELRDYLNSVLSSVFKLYVAPDGKKALELIRKYNPDIIVSDIGMPEMDGIELTKQVKNTFETSHIPIILLTAYSDKNDIIKGLQVGADDYITKPFDTSILLARIENIILNRQKIKDRFLTFSDSKTSTITYTSQRDQEFIEKAIALVENNISKDTISKEFFAKEMFVSPSLLYKKLKALTDQSPNEFVKVIKLKRALSLLQNGERSIAEVALETGFSDAKYFSTSFRKFYGKPPSSYIKNIET